MNRFKKVLVFAAFCICVNTGFAQSIKFEPTLTVFGSYTNIKSYSVLNAGLFNVEHSPLNFGVEISQKMYLDTLHFLRFGVRYQHFNIDIHAENQIPELHDYPYPFNWEYGYSAFTIPIHFGKDYYFNNLKKGDIYFGLSLGTLITTSFQEYAEPPMSKDNNSSDRILYGMLPASDKKSIFFPNFEAGINYSPLKNFRKLSVGINASIQLNKTRETKHIAVAEVPEKGYDFFYDFYNKNRIMDFSICAGYTF